MQQMANFQFVVGRGTCTAVSILFLMHVCFNVIVADDVCAPSCVVYSLWVIVNFTNDAEAERVCSSLSCSKKNTDSTIYLAFYDDFCKIV